MRYIVTDAGGTILKSGYASDPAQQAGTGETAYAVVGSDGGVIPDESVEVVDGAFAPKGGYLGDLPVADQLEVQ